MSKFATLSTRRSATPSLTVCVTLRPSPAMAEVADLEEVKDPVEPEMVMEPPRAPCAGRYTYINPISTIF